DSADWIRPEELRILEPPGPGGPGGRARGSLMSGDGLETPAAPATEGDAEDRAPSDAEIPAWVGKAVWRSTWQVILAVLLTWVGLWVLHQARDLVRYLILSLLLSFAIEPAVIYLHDKHGWRRGAGTGLILFAVFLLIAIISVLLGHTVINGFNGMLR